MNEIIDMHAHVTMNTLSGLHTSDATPAALKRLASASGIGHVVVLATKFPYKRSGVSAQFLLKQTRGDPFFTVFETVDMTRDPLDDELDALSALLREKRISGIKLYPGYQRFSLSDIRTYPVYEIARMYDVPVMVHGGELHSCCPRRETDRKDGLFRCGYAECPLVRDAFLSAPSQILPAAQAFPEVTFIVAHMGNPLFDELRFVMERCPNVHTDTSGQIVSGSPESNDSRVREWIVSNMLEVIRQPRGIERVLFGSDFPIQSYEDSIGFIDRLPLSSSEKDRILFQNAQTILHL
jgi:predicted TIM-barrel fold metal-dependent hydrolase